MYVRTPSDYSLLPLKPFIIHQGCVQVYDLPLVPLEIRKYYPFK